MQDKFKEFWLEKDKEEIIEAYIACIHNGEVLLARIDKAIEYIQDRYDGEALTHTFDKDNVKELLDILKGEE